MSYPAVIQVQLKAAHSHMTASYIAYKVSIPVHSPLTYFTLTFGSILSSTQCDFALTHALGSSIISTLHNPNVEMETGAAAKAWSGWKLGV